MSDLVFAYVCFVLAVAGALGSTVMGVLYSIEWRWQRRARRFS